MSKGLIRQSQTSAALERRLGAIIAAYDAQGNHRTGTEVDKASARWLAAEMRKSGVRPQLESYELKRLDPGECYLLVDGRRIEGVPLFDGGLTPRSGVSGVLGEAGSRAEVVLASAGTTLAATSSAGSKMASLGELRASGVKGIVLLTEGRRPGLSLLNATRFSDPSGPPVLQVSSSEREWLSERARAKLPVTLVVRATRTAAQSCNIIGKIPGRDRSLRPLVISTPRTGWWQSTGERGGGLACWLETLRMLAAKKPKRDCLFVSFSGHELGFLGIRAFIKRHPGALGKVHAWIHFGANLGAPRETFRIQCLDPQLEAEVLAALEDEGALVDPLSGNNGPPRGEVSMLRNHGVRYLAPICSSEAFHHSSDRWPEAVDLCALSKCASAFSRVAFKIANRGG
ncbi:MAG: M28 family peptidase [Burkholderiales bacterium]|nr:M28 family peptidase [Burkholderiales bacterium]